MVLVDPKRVELNHYEGIPHLLTPVVTSPRLAANVLGNLIKEMEERYGVMSRAKTRNLTELNRVRQRQGEPRAALHPLRDRRAGRPDDGRARPTWRTRSSGWRRSRARSGIHLVLATQRPSADVITGHDQGERAGADRVRGLLADRLARDPRPERRRVAARARATCSSGPPASRARRASRAPSSPRTRSSGSPTTGAARASRSCTRSCSRPWSPRRARTRAGRLRPGPGRHARATRSPRSSRWAPPRRRCSSAACGSATRAPAGWWT